ncbi:unnamed protein product [Schistosoma turkestanicum]|nr:unnamed protein product [Schistosoma turkestanicum]
MDPFQKRDKIPRTPPGQSFMDRSYIFDGTKNGDCSIYDESGSRRTSVYDTVKRYTLTFDNNGNTRTSCDLVSLDVSLSLKPNIISKNCLRTSSCTSSSQKYGLFTSSPVNESTPHSIKHPERKCDEQIVAGCVFPDKENIAPSEPVSPEIVTVKKRRVRRKCDVSSDNSAVSSSVSPAFAVPSTVRQLRPRRNANPTSGQSLSQQTESLMTSQSVRRNPTKSISPVRDMISS